MSNSQRMPPSSTKRSRAGSTIMEATVGLFILTVAATLVAQLVATSTAQLRQQDERTIAVQEAANVMDQVLHTPWDEFGQGGATSPRLSPAVQQQLPNSQLQVTASDPEGRPVARRVVVQISWAGPVADSPQHVRLVSWAFAPAGGQR